MSIKYLPLLPCSIVCISHWHYPSPLGPAFFWPSWFWFYIVSWQDNNNGCGDSVLQPPFNKHTANVQYPLSMAQEDSMEYEWFGAKEYHLLVYSILVWTSWLRSKWKEQNFFFPWGSKALCWVSVEYWGKARLLFLEHELEPRAVPMWKRMNDHWF